MTPEELLRYRAAGPRYTSYPTVPQWTEVPSVPAPAELAADPHFQLGAWFTQDWYALRHDEGTQLYELDDLRYGGVANPTQAFWGGVYELTPGGVRSMWVRPRDLNTDAEWQAMKALWRGGSAAVAAEPLQPAPQ